ncbi:MAG: hypothetical protein MK135_09180, partial [Polyangiaceae bacterium]|nr:hypothetical protein [Polyangiaceae bacterium]
RRVLQGASAWPYLWHRVRFILPRGVLRTLTHFIEVLLLTQMVAWRYLVPFFFLRGAYYFFTSFHWGWLEGLRRDIREVVRSPRPFEFFPFLRTWLDAHLLWCGVVVASAFIWSFYGDDWVKSFSVFDLYAVSLALRWCLEGSARLLHSSVFAFRRVARPLWSFLVVDLLEPLVLILSFRAWGLFAFSVTAVFVGVLRAGLSYYYSRRSLTNSRLFERIGGFEKARAVESKLLWGARQFPGKRGLAHCFGREPLLAGAANLSTQFDSFLFVLLARWAPQLAATFFILRPVFAMVTGALRSFYFDFKSLDERLISLEAGEGLRLAKSIRLGALALGGLGWVALLFLEQSRRLPLALALLVGLWVVLRPLLAMEQVTAFSARRYGALVLVAFSAAISLACADFVLAFWKRPNSSQFFLTIADLVLVGMISLLYKTRRASRVRSYCRTLTQLESAWRLAEGPLRVVEVVLDRQLRISRARFLEAWDDSSSLPNDAIFLLKGRRTVYCLYSFEEAQRTTQSVQTLVNESSDWWSCVQGFSAGGCRSVQERYFPSRQALFDWLRQPETKTTASAQR